MKHILTLLTALLLASLAAAAEPESQDDSRPGRATSTTDQRGVEHSYVYDSAGRLPHDRVTDLGSSGIVDDAILRITKTYDDIGRVESVTSYDDPDVGEGNVVNQIEYEYNGWGKLAREYQEHDGQVDANTPYVDYAYSDGASGGVAKYVRLSQVTYPEGREVHYGYGTTQAIDDIMSRLASIGDGSDNYAAYKYLGAGRIVEEDYEDLEVNLDYSANDFASLDRFGRVVDQVWNDYGEDPDVVLDEYTYTYDRAGNRTSRANELHSAFDEDYTYDGLDRLTDADRADAFDQSWGLDGLGNFSSFDDDGSSQNRTTNAVNEITGISGAWIDPTYDDAGNMISGPKPGDETTRVHYVYDAWNRLVAGYTDDGDGTFEPGTDDDLVATYEYDGANRRIEKTFADDTGVEYFYNHDWQMLEERAVDDEGTPTAINQYVWSARYIDAPVVRFHDANADGDVLDEGDNTRYFTGDANYNITATIDAAADEVVERYVYTAYGTATVYDADWANPAAPTTDGPLYCGYFFDAETALYQVRNRYYDSSLSTFISRDPIKSNLNPYLYVSSAPIMGIDPFGEHDIANITVDKVSKGLFHDWIAQGTITYSVSTRWEVIMTLSGSNCDCSSETKKVSKTVSPNKGTKVLSPLSITHSAGKAAGGIVQWGKDQVRQALKTAGVPLSVSTRILPWTYELTMEIAPGTVRTATVYRRIEHYSVIGSVHLWDEALLQEWPGSDARPGWDDRGIVSVFGAWEVYTTHTEVVYEVKPCPK